MSNTTPELRSKCCRAAVTVGGDDREGTHYYVCANCGQSCDPADPAPVAIQRLIDEVRDEPKKRGGEYNRMHNRHNRGMSRY